ncbi:hypothetical protein CTI12_AA423820 [Artemisia annua]|uniref:Uncharacterized protein n=1 Tax=Artemisia annua TaxID=35608 RepID=A0A2U1M408_ARTAN|nr:hypothetical protein CTI12_AA423820 [Artemisia annua]
MVKKYNILKSNRFIPKNLMVQTIWIVLQCVVGVALKLGAGAVFGMSFGQEIANLSLQLYKLDTMAARVNFMEWWQRKSARSSYRAILFFTNLKHVLVSNGLVVDVKRLKRTVCQGGELRFQMEVEMISMAAHPNLLLLQVSCMA